MQKIAAIQMCSTALVDENLETAAQFIAEAAKQKAALVVLPEMFAIMGKQPTDAVAVKEKFGHGKIQSFLAAQAKQHGVWLVGGTIPIACDDKNKARAATLVFNAQGNVVARYDKIHLFDVEVSATESYKESNTIQPGTELVVVDTPVGKLGLAVCYDVRFPELFRCLFNKGAELFALPSAFTAKTGAAHWDLLTRSRAVENFSYVIGAAQGGTHANGRSTYGNTVIVEPWGEIVAQAPGVGAGVIYADIDLQKLHALRKSIPVGEHQRIFFDLAKL